ncbi:MAG: LuxR family transcriptional regulator [Actinobacteria bacterium]|nr:LuxR family transcriptional regulator [Actinomycetota bacterium]
MMEHIAGPRQDLPPQADKDSRLRGGRAPVHPRNLGFRLVGRRSRENNQDMVKLAIEGRQRFVHLVHRGLNLSGFFDAADRTLAGLVQFDSSCWLSLDPATLLPTSHFTREIGSDHLMELAANEFLEDDVNKFAGLARAARPVAILSKATRGELQRSPRFTRVLAPHGYEDGDELRATFLAGESAWGCVALHRRRGRFEDRDAEVVVDLAGCIGEGIRRAILSTVRAADDGELDQPGLILLRGDDSVESMTPAANRWIGEMFDSTADSSTLPLIVISVANKARRACAGLSEEMASLRVPRVTGGWFLLHASLLPGDGPDRVGVMIDPVREPQIAALIVDAYGLSQREREVTRLVLHGLSTRDLADELHVSAYTVQDHLKSIFAKVGVRSRRELVAQLFFHHYAPRLENGATPGSNGWFADGH